jgi:protein arginine kinase activator
MTCHPELVSESQYGLYMKCCSVCGSTFDQIVKSQRIGCAECYYTFAEEFRATLESYGISGSYKGSLPKRLKGYRSTLVDRMTMQIKLEEAVAAEDYEKAALYRDYLKVLNHGTETKDGQQ